MIVVDASAVFSVLLGQPIGEVVLRALRGGAQGSRRTGTSTGPSRLDHSDSSGHHVPTGPTKALIAPDFLALEVANSVIQMRRRARQLGLEVSPNAVDGCFQPKVLRKRFDRTSM